MPATCTSHCYDHRNYAWWTLQSMNRDAVLLSTFCCPLQIFSTAPLPLRDVNENFHHFRARKHSNPLQDSGNYMYHQLGHKKLCRLPAHCICVSWFELRNGWWNRGSISGRCKVICSPMRRLTLLSSGHGGWSGPGLECDNSPVFDISFLELYLHSTITVMSCCSLSRLTTLVFVASLLELRNSSSFGWS